MKTVKTRKNVGNLLKSGFLKMMRDFGRLFTNPCEMMRKRQTIGKNSTLNSMNTAMFDPLKGTGFQWNTRFLPFKNSFEVSFLRALLRERFLSVKRKIPQLF